MPFIGIGEPTCQPIVDLLANGRTRVDKMAGIPETQKRRITMRATHRGIKEMDIILGRFVAAALDGLSASEAELFEAFMEIDDQSLYAIILGRIETAPIYQSLVHGIRAVNQIGE